MMVWGLRFGALLELCGLVEENYRGTIAEYSDLFLNPNP